MLGSLSQRLWIDTKHVERLQWKVGSEELDSEELELDSAESPTLEIPIISKAAKDGSLAVKWVLKERERTAEASTAIQWGCFDIDCF